ncbi:hypothetical protein SHIRM173S_03742 [Streptomyces hirsutus]
MYGPTPGSGSRRWRSKCTSKTKGPEHRAEVNRVLHDAGYTIID